MVWGAGERNWAAGTQYTVSKDGWMAMGPGARGLGGREGMAWHAWMRRSVLHCLLGFWVGDMGMDSWCGRVARVCGSLESGGGWGGRRGEGPPISWWSAWGERAVIGLPGPGGRR